MKTNHSLSILYFVLLIGPLVFGCRNPLDPGSQPEVIDASPTEPSRGALAISTKAASRTIEPVADLKSLVHEYRVVFTSHSGGEADFTVSSYDEGASIDAIPVGDWNVVLVGLDSDGAEIVRGVPDAGNPVTILAGRSTAVSVTICPLESGTGTLAWTVSFPPGVAEGVTVSLDPMPIGGDDTIELVVDTDYTVSFVDGALTIRTELDAGAYFLSVALLKSLDPVVSHPPFAEVVRIFGNLTSEKTTQLVSGQFSRAPDAPSALTASSGDDPYSIALSWQDNSYFEEGFELQSSTDEGSTWADVASDPYPLIPGTKQYVHVGITPGAPVQYRLRAVNRFGASAWASTSATLLVPVYDGNGHTVGSPPVAGRGYFAGETGTVHRPDGLLGPEIDAGIRQRFLQWNTRADGTGDSYEVSAGVGSFVMGTEGITFYAQWTGDDGVVGKHGPAGGVVFYDDEADGVDDIPGARYLEAVPYATNLYYASWGGDGTEVGAAARGSAVGDGVLNTAAIVAAYGGISNYAAKVCANLTLGGFDDWFLPSAGELEEMRVALASVSDERLPPSSGFWSSTECSATEATHFSVTDTGSSSVPRSKSLGETIRAVRAFSTAAAAHVLRFEGNGLTGGSLPPAALVDVGAEVVLPGIDGLRGPAIGDGIGQRLVGWNTVADGSGTSYAPGAAFVMPSATTVLYAIWSTGSGVIGKVGPGGGLVFYDDEADGVDDVPGARYLESAPHSTEVASAPWGGSDASTTGAQETNVGGGLINTARVVTAYGDAEPNAGRSDYAAKACADLTVGDFSDWYLPATDELELIHSALVGDSLGGFAEAAYWSSTAGATTNAKGVDLATGLAAESAPATEYRVRAVRMFRSASPGYVVTYRPGGVSAGVAPDPAWHEAGDPVDVPDGATLRGPVIDFAVTQRLTGWTSDEAGTGTLRLPGGSFAMPAVETTLYAQWTADASFVDKVGPHGGIVVHDDQVPGAAPLAGGRFLEAAPSDGPSLRWAASAVPVGYDARGVAVGTGPSNVETILSVLGPSTDYAAGFCDSLTAGGSQDWHLPSIDEIEAAYTTLGLSGTYWSSTESASGAALGFGDSGPFEAAKADAHGVRAVSVFGEGGDYFRLRYEAPDANAGEPPPYTVHEAGDSVALPEAPGLIGPFLDSVIRLRHTRWTTESGGTGVSYDTGAAYPMPGNEVELHAAWSTNSDAVGNIGPAGGVIFYDDEADGTDDIAGARYLEAAPRQTEWTGVSWSAVPVELGRSVREDALGSGASNTAAALHRYHTAGDVTPTPALLCDALTAGVYADWYLPSSSEVDAMLSVLAIEGTYWSSTEYDAGKALAHDGAQAVATAKSAQRTVRAVRAFNDAGSLYVVSYVVDANVTGTPPAWAFHAPGNSAMIAEQGDLGVALRDGIRRRLVEWQAWESGRYTYRLPGTAPTMPSSPVALAPVWTTGEDAVGNVGPGGGLVFYDDEADGVNDIVGGRYLEAAPPETEWVDRVWGGSGQVVGGNLWGLELGTGAANTAHIVSVLGAGQPGEIYAAKLCHDLVHGGYEDWFLPSLEEARLMSDNLHASGLGGFSDGEVYLTSAENGSVYAYGQGFPAGEFNYLAHKDGLSGADLHPVRAARAFGAD